MYLSCRVQLNLNTVLNYAYACGDSFVRNEFSRLNLRSCMSLPDPELQAGVRLFCSMVQDHVGADDKGVFKEQGVRHALHAAVDGLLAGLTLAQALKAKQRQRLMKTA